MGQEKILVTGAGGFIGHHLVTELKKKGHWVRGIDLKYPEFSKSDADEFKLLDLRKWDNCLLATRGIDQVYALAADMGGMGFISCHHSEILHNNSLINIHTLEAARLNNIKEYLYTSSACIYPEYKQAETNILPLKEEDAYPAMPQDAYGWEKLIAERLCAHYREDYGMNTHIVRFHNIFGTCYDEETEVLTKNGFKFFSDVTFEDEIATLNPTTMGLEYQHPVDIQAFPYKGPMHKIKTSRLNLLVTPDHSVFYSGYTTGENSKRKRLPFRLSSVNKIWDRTVSLFLTGFDKWEGTSLDSIIIPGVDYTDGRTMGKRGGEDKIVPIDTWLKFLGWYLSEGSHFVTPSNYTVVITQKSDETRKEIAGIIEDMGFHPTFNDIHVIISSKQLYSAVKKFGNQRVRFIPKDILTLPQQKLQLLFDILMRGDGHKDRLRYSSISKQLADDVMEIGLKLGFDVNIRYERRGIDNKDYSIYRVNFSKTKIHKFTKEHKSVVDYDGLVFDVTVPNHHIIFVRRGGYGVWSGNCGTWRGGREKAPAALCRKIAVAKLTENPVVDIWGDGKQTRSFCYIDDCVKGIYKLMQSDFYQPLNLGQDRMVSINQLADIVAKIAGYPIRKNYISGPEGVRGRNSDNTLLRKVLKWEPEISLEEGLKRTYQWIETLVSKELKTTSSRKIAIEKLKTSKIFSPGYK